MSTGTRNEHKREKFHVESLLVGTSATELTANQLLGVAVVPADATTYTVLAANSGRKHIVPDLTATCTITLPAAVAGLNFEFWYGGAAADAADWVIVPTAGVFKGGVNHQDTDGETTAAVYSNGSSNDVFTVIKPEAGTRVNVISNGTDWYVNGIVCSVTVPTMGDS